MPNWKHLAIAAVVCLTGCARPEAGYRIVVIPKGLTHEFWQSIERGARQAAADLSDRGVPTSIIWDGPLRERDALSQIRIVDRRAMTGASGIVLAPQHSRTMAAPVQRAVERGIPCVIIDSGLEDDNLFVKYVATNNYNGGWLAGQHLLGVLAAEGRTAPRLVMLRYQIGSESTDQREQGFEDYVNAVIARQRQEGMPTITWLSTDKYAGATKDSALRASSPLVNRLRDQIDGIFAPNESSASGMLDALRSLGLSQRVRRLGPEPNDALRAAVAEGAVGAGILDRGEAEADSKLLTDPERMARLGLVKQVHLMGFDSSEPLLQSVGDGEMDGLILQDPYKMGYLGVWVLVHYLEGYDVAAGAQLLGSVEQVSNGALLQYPGRLGLLGVAALMPALEGCDRHDPKVLGTGEHVITRANLNALSTRELFNPELQRQRRLVRPVYWLKRPAR